MGQEEGGSRALSRGAAWDRLAAALHWQGASRWRLGSLLGSLPRLTTSAHYLGSLPRLTASAPGVGLSTLSAARCSLLISRRAAQGPVGGCGAAVRPGQPILNSLLLPPLRSARGPTELSMSPTSTPRGRLVG